MTADTRTPDEIERDLARNRAAIDETVTALQQKLSPGQMLDRFMELARGQGGEFGKNLGRTVRDHPVPAVMTAVGLAWLAASGTSTGGHADTGRSSRTTPAPREGWGAESALESAGDRASASLAHAGHQVSRAAHDAGTTIQQAGNLLHDHPLAAGLLSFGLGAALAAFMPQTEEERVRMRRMRREIEDRAGAATRTLKEEVKQGTERVAAAGLSGDESTPDVPTRSERGPERGVAGQASGRPAPVPGAS